MIIWTSLKMRFYCTLSATHHHLNLPKNSFFFSLWELRKFSCFLMFWDVLSFIHEFASKRHLDTLLATRDDTPYTSTLSLSHTHTHSHLHSLSLSLFTHTNIHKHSNTRTHSKTHIKDLHTQAHTLLTLSHYREQTHSIEYTYTYKYKKIHTLSTSFSVATFS